ncbi:MAG: hypothetical protein ACRDKJ_09675 [Actinomycetota bacterium]
MRNRSISAIALSVLLVFAGCSSGEKVGSAIDVEDLDEKARRLGEFEAEKDKGAGGFVGEQEQQRAQQQQQQQQQVSQEELERRAQEEAAVTFNITGAGFDPFYIRVFQFGVIQVTNRDSQPRSVIADRQEFDSGMIAPGSTWTYEAAAVGKFNFHDGTRPFVVGTLEVLAG